MNCREFEKLWDDLLDARWEPLAHHERPLEAHASGCPRCRALSSRYQVLGQAVSSLRPPTPSAESIERLYALTVPARPPRIAIQLSNGRHRLRGPLAAAAAFALAWLGGGWWPAHQPDVRLAPNTGSASVSRRALGLVLANATEATLDLAREASAPASRIGREVFDLGQSSTLSPVPDAESSEEPESAPSDLWKAVGERVGAGVKPISGSARHAFSFLLGPPEEPGPVVPPKQDSL